MSKDSDDVTKCPVCFEAYTETGDHLPRLLPCTHTLCHQCTLQLMKKGNLTCPQDREVHLCKKGIKAFPHNKYILNLLQSKVNKVGFEVCQKHQREQNLYCNRRSCRAEICSLCMMKDHSKHRHCVEDLQRIKEVKHAEIITEVEILSKSLEECRKTIQGTKDQLDRDVIKSMLHIKNANNTVCNTKIPNKLCMIEETVVTINNITKDINVRTPYSLLTKIKSELEKVKMKAVNDLKEPIKFTLCDIKEKEMVTDLRQKLGLKPKYGTKEGKFSQFLVGVQLSEKYAKSDDNFH